VRHKQIRYSLFSLQSLPTLRMGTLLRLSPLIQRRHRSRSPPEQSAEPGLTSSATTALRSLRQGTFRLTYLLQNSRVYLDVVG
jgi:hypothetical protein